MLINELQFAVTKKKLEVLGQRIAEMNAEGDELSLKRRLILNSLLDVSQEMEAEVAEYELRTIGKISQKEAAGKKTIA
jgi:hypothetical protein